MTDPQEPTEAEFGADQMQEVLERFQRLNPDQKAVFLELLRKLAIADAMGEDPEALFKDYKERLRRLA